MAKKKTAKLQAGRLDDAAEKQKALLATLGRIDKDFGKGAIMCLGDDAVQDVEVISTGSVGLDFALGVGGLHGAGSPKSTAPRLPERPRSRSTS